MKSIIRILIATFVIVGVIGNAQARHHGDHGPKVKVEKMVKKMTHKLDLNEQQAANFKEVATLMAEHRRAHHGAKGPMPIQPEQIQELLSTPELDQAKALGYIEEHIQQMRQHSQEMIPVVAKFTNSLNEEQRAKLSKLMDKKFTRHAGKGHKRGKNKGHDSNYNSGYKQDSK